MEDVASEMGIGFLGLGFDPLWKREDIPVMPKGRYDIMKEYMPKVGSMGLDMMFRTSTIQVRLARNFHSPAFRRRPQATCTKPQRGCTIPIFPINRSTWTLNQRET